LVITFPSVEAIVAIAGPCSRRGWIAPAPVQYCGGVYRSRSRKER